MRNPEEDVKPLELESQVIVNCLGWVLGTEPRSFARVLSTAESYLQPHKLGVCNNCEYTLAPQPKVRGKMNACAHRNMWTCVDKVISTPRRETSHVHHSD